MIWLMVAAFLHFVFQYFEDSDASFFFLQIYDIKTGNDNEARKRTKDNH